MSSFVTGTVVPTPTLPFLSTAAALLPALSRTSSTGFAPVAEVERITSVPPASPEPPTPKAPETVVEPKTTAGPPTVRRSTTWNSAAAASEPSSASAMTIAKRFIVPTPTFPFPRSTG